MSEFQQPDNFNDDIKSITGFSSICAIKNSGDLGCWNPNSLLFDEMLPKYSKNISQKDSNLHKTCVITTADKLKCWE